MRNVGMAMTDWSNNEPHKLFQTRSSSQVLALLCFALLWLGGCAEPPGTAQLVDRTEHGASPQLLVKAQELLKDRIILVDRYSYEWSSRTLFRVYTRGGKEGILLENNGDYVQVNSPSSLGTLNEILQERRFAREEFVHAEAVFHSLGIVVDLYEGAYRSIGSSTFLGVLGPEGIAEWSRGSKKKEITLRESCRDPQFAFRGNNWIATFNVFEPDGRVEKWKVEGEFCTATQSNRVQKIERRVVKKRGTFAYAAWG
jgi:hypothetical protein